MTAVHETCARIGLVTGKGIAAVVKDNYTVYGNYPCIGDIYELQGLFPYPQMAGAGFIVLPGYGVHLHQDWPTVMKANVVPLFEFTCAFLFIITGVFGTTITLNMFFWEASQEVGEAKEEGLLKKDKKPAISWEHIKKMRIDNNAGMLISEFTTWCILFVGATVLHNSGIKDIKSAADAAKALEPLVYSFPNAGFMAKLIFSIGIIGLGLLAVPVLSGSAAYEVSEAFEWKASLHLKLRRAHGFYGVITIPP